MKALLIVDLQQDFCPGGSLAVAKGDEVARGVLELLRGSGSYAAVCTTQDWHVTATDHFAAHATPTTPPDYVSTWPRHCLAESSGASLHDLVRLGLAEHAARRTEVPILRFFKGHRSAAYSGFEAQLGAKHAYNAASSPVELEAALKQHSIDELDVCGIATDHCVRATVLDALRLKFKVNVLTKLLAHVHPKAGAEALKQMEAAGARLI